jgi:hypothetical protein
LLEESSMMHVTYALFDDEEHARAALTEIEASGTPRRSCGVVLHKDHLDEGLLHLSESGAAGGIREGVAIGGILGAGMGAAVVGPAGLVSGGALGALYGAVAGAIAGSGGPDWRLEQLSKRLADGKVLLVVEAPSFECREKADAAAAANGGHVEHKPFF